jgi:hypothetical protein
MRKILSDFFNGIGCLFSTFVLFGAIIEQNIIAKIIYILAALLICPFFYFIIKKKVIKKRYIFARVSGFFVGFILLIVSTVFFADNSINEKMVVEKGAVYIQNKYYDYDAISIKEYDISDVDTNNSKKVVKLELIFNAAKGNKIEKKTEICYVVYNEETGEYMLEDYK